MNVNRLAASVIAGASSLYAAEIHASTITYDISALIDGTSLLIIQSNTIAWHNLISQVPGKYTPGVEGGEFHDDPTIITTTRDGNPILSNYAWYPVWPNPVFEGPLQAGDQTSALFTGLDPQFPSHDVVISLLVEEGRGSVSIDVLPSQSNGYSTVLLFADPLAGAVQYRAKVTFTDSSTSIPEPYTMFPVMVGFGLMIRGVVFARRQAAGLHRY